ncbi:MAG: alpha-L-arabinofuranosidase [Bacilli bacterium]|nr:alpha-L-arabinofuranosidase [Bacilli bacterium]
MKKNSLITLALTFVLCMFIGVNPKEAKAADPNTAYILSYFGGAPYSESVHFAFSSDGKFWTPLHNNNGIVNATKGTKSVRDPFVLRKQDNTFVVMATQGWDTNSIYIWDSTNLSSFTNERLVQVNNFSGRAWAPQAIWNPAANNYMVYWTGNVNGGANRTYYNTTTDFVNFSTPNVLFDPGYDEIDADIQYWNGTYYLYYKDERSTGKRILSATSNSLTPGSFVLQSPTLSPLNTEGPASFKSITENKWYMYYDFFNNGGKFGLSYNYDITNPNGWIAEQPDSFSAPAGVRHGSIVKVSAWELNNLKTTWGVGYTQTRWESSNYPGSYIRHQDSYGRIDADANINPYSDSQWNMVPGLADASGVSFQSTLYPDRYLRHRNGEVFLDTTDNSTVFKADATWYKRPGLANSSQVSFESYNYPGEYIRHNNSLLYRQPIVTALDRSDATFSQH